MVVAQERRQAQRYYMLYTRRGLAVYSMRAFIRCRYFVYGDYARRVSASKSVLRRLTKMLI